MKSVISEVVNKINYLTSNNNEKGYEKYKRKF